MKKTIKFTGDPYEDVEEFEIIENASKMHGVLFEITHNFRRKFIKHSEDSDEYIRGMEFIMQAIIEEIEEQGLSI